MAERESTRIVLERLRQEVADHPDSAKAHTRLGVALLKHKGTLKDAEEAFRKAVEIDPKCAEAWVNLGGALFSQFDFSGSVEANRQAGACQPELLLAHYNEGLGHLFLGQSEEMVACFRRVLELDAEHPGGNYHLAVGLLGLGQLDEAQVYLAKSVALGHSPQPEVLRTIEREKRQRAQRAESAAQGEPDNHN